MAALVVFLLAAWLFGSALTLTDGERTVLRVGLVVLGIAAAVALFWYLRPVDVPLVATGADKDDALVALAAARARLPRGAFDAKPLVLVVGATGSTKTTVVSRAGLDAALLAGDAPALEPGDMPPPTAAANVWLAGDAVVAEPSGAVFADAARWKAFLRALRAPRLAAAIGRAEPAARAAVLCVPCDVFYAGDAQAQAEQLAQVARERLAEAARELGLALPVYVLFTKADRIPQFEPWAAPFTRDEVRAPLGAALPFDAAAGGAGAVGGYAERVAPRLDAAFAELTDSLAGRRLDLLGRESVAERRLAAYEFPREVGKLAPAATRFLAAICQPTALGAAPQLRGFYFVGARPVQLTERGGGSAAAARPAMAGAGATHAFIRPGAPAEPAVGSYGPPSTRRVPQWAFLDRLFPDVILADRGAAAAARGGVRVASLRRALLGAGVAALVLLTLGVARSWANNRDLAGRTDAAARAVAALPTVAAPAGTIAFPSSEALRTLDGLRAMLDTLGAYDADGVPARFGFGLWRGPALLEAGRRVWNEGYRRELHGAAWGALVDSLRALPDAPRPGDDYGRVYAGLKGYLETTSDPQRATPEFLAPVLLASWQRGQPTDADVTGLARRQFEYYARELPAANPFPTAADANLVRRTRDFLGRFAGTERIYQYMLAEADKATKPARLAEVAPQAAGLVTAPDVPGSFTAKGWAYMQDAFRSSDRYFQGEPWVVGDAGAAQAQDRDKTLTALRARYRADYVARWRAYVRGIQVARAGSAKDAGAKLGALGGAQSPLLAALALAARNTIVDSGVAAAFQPVQVVTPGTVLDKYVGEGNQPYVNGLLALQGAVEQVGNLPPAIDSAGAIATAQAGQQALTQATQAKVAARQVAQKFAVDSAAAQVGPAVAALLEAPITSAEGTLRLVAATRPPPGKKVAAAGGGGGGGGGGAAPAPAPAPVVSPAKAAEMAAALNERGKALCAAMTPVLAKFPFNPDAGADATVAEVNALLAPGTGALWALEQERMEGLVDKQGEGLQAKFVPKPASPVGFSAPFLAFFNRAAEVSYALYGGAPEPRVVFTVQSAGGKEATLSQGTQAAPLGGDAPPAQFSWPSTTGREAKLQLGYKKLIILGRTAVVARAGGEWAMFHLAAQAASWDGAGGAARVQWNSGQGPVAVQFTFPNGAPVLKRGWLGGMACVGQVTR